MFRPVALCSALARGSERRAQGADDPVEVEGTDLAELNGREGMRVALAVIRVLKVDEEAGDEDGSDAGAGARR